MNLLFVYSTDFEDYWKDGLWAALNVLDEEWDVTVVNLRNADYIDLKDYDFALGWGAFGSPADKFLRDKDIKKGLCIAGNAIPPNEFTGNYDILFYETEWYRPQIEQFKNIKRAFGVNTEIFHLMDLPKTIDVLSVGSFSNWKNHHKITDEDGVRLVIGEIQIGNWEESMNIIRYLVEHGVGVMDMVPPESLAVFYNLSKLLYIPAHVVGGGERAVWEARSCGIDVKVSNDNPKLKELLYEEVLDHFAYAESLREGILGCQ